MWLASDAFLALWLLFWAYWFRLEQRRWLHRIVWPMAVLSILSATMLGPPLYGRVVPLGAAPWLLHLEAANTLLGSLLLIAVAILGTRKNRVDGMLALPALLMVLLGYSPILDALHLPTTFHPFGAYIPVGQLGTMVSLSMITVLLLRRFFLGLREREHMRQEIEQARIVQNVLIPDEVPAVPGFRIDCVYKPAGQVGGDFFQVLPLREGGALLCIGDVSGKGMPAAMTVALLVGTLRTLAHYTQRPGEILSAMNQRMIGRNNGGFTTCLLLRIGPDGALTLANAGHLPPYINGAELASDPGLPLGLAADAAWAETSHSLAPGDTLTLLTDGVVEARSPAGALFGFDRTSAISRQSAEAIAQAAQAFGQQDDITVLTLAFAPAEVLSA